MTGSCFEFYSEFLHLSGIRSDFRQIFDVSLFAIIMEQQGLIRRTVTGKYVSMPEICNRGSEHAGWQVLDLLQKQQQVGMVCRGDSSLLADQLSHDKWY